jgi:hypothetical protein
VKTTIAWLIGLFNAAISGLASGLTSLAVGVSFKHVMQISGVSAVVSLGKWLAQHPLPGQGNGATPPQAPPPVTPIVQGATSVAEQMLQKKL